MHACPVVDEHAKVQNSHQDSDAVFKQRAKGLAFTAVDPAVATDADVSR